MTFARTVRTVVKRHEMQLSWCTFALRYNVICRDAGMRNRLEVEEGTGFACGERHVGLPGGFISLEFLRDLRRGVEEESLGNGQDVFLQMFRWTRVCVLP
jgi:hypothetical protein